MSGRDLSWTGDRGAGGFGPFGPEDECLHPQDAIPGDSLTETWAYMWYVPEERICALIYVWVHPNLNLVTAGLGVWRGHKYSMISAELMDVHAFVSASTLGDGRDMLFPNGLRVQLIEPFKEMRVTFDDPARGNALDLTITGVGDPVMRASRKHFDQVTWNKGTLNLRGKAIAVDSYGMRDRSWGELRPEEPMAGPPFTWMNGTFAESGMSWLLSGFDDPARGPEWAGLFDVDPATVTHESWLIRDGVQSRLKHASKITHRDPQTLRPVSHEIHFVDEWDREYHIQGEILASLPWVGWPNQVTNLCLTKWTMNGEVGFGDTQDVHWSDFVHALRGDQG